MAPARVAGPDGDRDLGRGFAQAAPKPTLLWHVLTLGWLGLALPATAQVEPGFRLFLIVVLYGALLGAVWLFAIARALLSREARARLTARAIAGWLALPAMVLLVALLLSTRWPLVLRVRLSETALLELARDPRERARPVRAGLMLVDDVHADADCVFLHTSSGFIFRELGLAYSPDGAEPASRYRGFPTTFRHLTGAWWTFEATD